MENAQLYALRAVKLQENDPDRTKYFELALAEVDKIMLTDVRGLYALSVKGYILRHYAPADAIQVYERFFELDQEGSANYARLEAMMDEVNVAKEAGDIYEAVRLAGAVKAYKASGAFMCHIGSGPHRLVDVKIDFAEAHETLGNWLEALEIYDDTRSTIDDETIDGLQHRTLIAGTARCLHHLGVYDSAVNFGEAAFFMNRQHPGGHMLIALPQLALGQVEAARTTMRRGIVYEDPWDDENRQKNIEFLHECLRTETTEGGVAPRGE
jgi:tetratricopeptide (TPR) repeat protein